MKNIILSIFIFIIPSINYGQDFFLRVGLSSDHSFLSSQFHSPLESIVGSDVMKVNDQGFSQKVSKGTYSEGFKYSLGIGKDFNNYVSILFDVNYQKGSGVQDVFTHIPNFESSQFSKSETIRFIPGAILSTGNQKRMSGYMRIGLIVPVWGKVNSQTIVDDQTGQIYAMLSQEFNPNISTKLHLESDTSGKLSFGIQSSLGIEYQIFNRLNLFSEVGFSNLNIGLNTSKVIAVSGAVSIPGVSDIPLDIDALPKFIKKINYQDELTAQSNSQSTYGSFDPNKDLDALNYGSNFNSISIGFGVKLKL